jgi:hypothetical protein
MGRYPPTEWGAPMRDLPGGQWSPLLIGHQWPGSDSLAVLAAAAQNRAAAADAHTSYAESLRSVREGLMADQQGIAADSARLAFRAGEDFTRGVVENNETKRDAYRSAHRYVAELRSALGDIARSGDDEIRQVLDSQRPLADKISAIVNTIATAQTQANTKAAECSANVFTAIEAALGTARSGLSAREFTSTNGVDVASAFRSPVPEILHRQVEAALAEAGSPPATAPGQGQPAAVTGEGQPAPSIVSPGQLSSAPTVESAGAGAALTATGTGSTEGPAARADVATADRSGPFGLPGAEVLAAGLSLAGDTAAISEPASTAHGDTSPGATTQQPRGFAAPVPATDFDEPPSVVAPVGTALTSPAAPVGPPAPVTVGASGAAASSLPTYGSDLRVTATPPAPAPVPAAAPGSAPVSTAGTSAATGAPVVLRRGPDSTARPAAAAAVGDVQSVAVAPGPQPENRLRRLLCYVARQQPQLRWAVGNLDDGSTLLVTDLAGGWIPPGTQIPSGVRLPQPRRSTGDLATLLSSAILTATYQPGQQLPAADDESMPTSGQAWQTTPVDDLGWELTKSTKWREGLPRLAHTMAKAMSARSGYLASEITLLREYLGCAADAVLSRYPSAVGAAELGNWQLLASTEALIRGEKDRANYHFAWFLAHAAVPQTAVPR